MLGDKRFIHSIRLRNILSFGDDAKAINLRSLNVLIGPNASGKSNLIDAIDFLRAAPSDLLVPIRRGGGIIEWLWKGAGDWPPTAEIEVVVDYPNGESLLRHDIPFTIDNQQEFSMLEETIESAQDANSAIYHYDYSNASERTIRTRSVLAFKRDHERYPEITYLGYKYSEIAIYREWSFTRNPNLHKPQFADLPKERLLDDASNLALVINHLKIRSDQWDRFKEELRRFNPAIMNIDIDIYGNSVQVILFEEGLRQPIPSARVSSGTMQYICLLAILLNPTPPPLICIEEPEIGLHPDILRHLAELLIEASHRTQLIVTTHSEVLVDALTETPEAVLVCEKMGASTTLLRLEKDSLKEWLERYSLGELWRMGEIGGNRW